MACTVDAPGCADIVDNHYPRALFAEAFDALAGAVLLFGFAYEEAIQFAAHHGDRDHDGIRAHGEAADRLRLPSALPNFFPEDFSGQPRAFGVERGGTAVDVVIAGAAGREFEVTQPERLVSERAKQFLACRMHQNLRYHEPQPQAPGLGIC